MALDAVNVGTAAAELARVRARDARVLLLSGCVRNAGRGRLRRIRGYPDIAPALSGVFAS